MAAATIVAAAAVAAAANADAKANAAFDALPLYTGAAAPIYSAGFFHERADHVRGGVV